MNQILDDLFSEFKSNFNLKLKEIDNRSRGLSIYQQEGYISSINDGLITAKLLEVSIGELCEIDNGGILMYAEVISIKENSVYLLPLASTAQLSINSKIRKLDRGFTFQFSEQLLGSVIDGFGNEIKRLTIDIPSSDSGHINININNSAPQPLTRKRIDKQLITGITVLDFFIPCGIGQRIGIFAKPGVGKTTLLGMIVKNAIADIVIVVLIGERGREVREFIEDDLDPKTYKRTIVIIATQDRPAVEQIRAAYVAQSIAEYFRSNGKNVVLLFDSITRLTRALREIALCAGESISRGGYPASVFTRLPKLIERAGNDEYGSITAFYTVLSESETNNDPVSEEVRSIVDGHIILSRDLAVKNHFPAIDLIASLSRLETKLLSPETLDMGRYIRKLVAEYQNLEFLIRIGEYKSGTNPLSDEAIKKYPEICKFLSQSMKEERDYQQSSNQLQALCRN